MNKIEREFFHLREEIQRYTNAGINDGDFLLMKSKVSEAEEIYKRFKNRTGILEICERRQS